eukprot:360770-Chlamydomonas_euryale.AAC.6
MSAGMSADRRPRWQRENWEGCELSGIRAGMSASRRPLLAEGKLGGLISAGISADRHPCWQRESWEGCELSGIRAGICVSTDGTASSSLSPVLPSPKSVRAFFTGRGLAHALAKELSVRAIVACLAEVLPTGGSVARLAD